MIANGRAPSPSTREEAGKRFYGRFAQARLLKTGVAWKDTPEKIPLAVRHVRSFLLSHRPA